MARTYAGILGFLAASVTMLRGIFDGASSEGTFGTAVFSLLVFAGIGAMLGAIAEATVRESVRFELEQELARNE